MEMREIGHSGIIVNGLGMGCWAIGGGSWWGENDDRQSIDTIHQAARLGIEWIDTARVYGFGHSEEVVGRALRTMQRSRVILSTKCALQWHSKEGEYHFSRDGHDVYRNLKPTSIRQDLEMSLKGLGTDYIDVLYTHWQCRKYGYVPVDETMGELIRMKKEGKIRAIGASNVNLQVLQDYASSGELDVIQEKLSILDRKPEAELLPFCEAHGISLQTYSPIEQGLLSGKIPDNYTFAPGNVREGKFWWKPEHIPMVNEMLRNWSDLTKKYSCTLTNLCIRWNSMLSPCVHVLCGARRLDQINDVARSLEIPMTRDDFNRMRSDADALIAKVGKA